MPLGIFGIVAVGDGSLVPVFIVDGGEFVFLKSKENHLSVKVS